MVEQRTGEADRRKAVQESVEIEVSSFPQNIEALEAIIGKMGAEFSSLAPKVDRLAIYQSDVQSMLEEVKAQQARAMAVNGSEDMDVQRLQLLLSTRVAGIIDKVDEYLSNSRDKLGVLQYRSDAIDPAAAELADILAGRHESAKGARDRVEDVALAAKRLADFIGSNPGSKPGLEPILDKLLTISLQALVERRTQSLREPPRPPIDNPPGPGDDDGMEPRIANLEKFADEARRDVRSIDVRLGKLEATADGISRNMATRTELAELKGAFAKDLSDLKGSVGNDLGNLKDSVSKEIGNLKGAIAQVESTLLKWFIGTAIALTGLAFTIAKFVH